MANIFLTVMDVLMTLVRQATWALVAFGFFGTLWLLITRHNRQVKKDKLYLHLVSLRAAGQRAVTYEKMKFADEYDDPRIIHDVPSIYDILFTPENEGLLRYLCPNWEKSYAEEIIDDLVLDADELIVEFADTVHAPSLWNWCVVHDRVSRFPADVARSLQMNVPLVASEKATQSFINQLEA